MIITLFQATKRENSTKIPTGGVELEGQLRNDSSVTAPTIEFSMVNPTGYNYAHIPLFNRFYFIENWSYDGGMWSAAMKVDVLASYRETIGASTQYVIRSAAASDGDIIDQLYPAKASAVVDNQVGQFFGLYPARTYVLGIIGNNSSGGALTYYAMTQSQFDEFSTELMGNVDYIGNIGDFFTMDFLKTQFNPFQYVSSVMVFPFDIDGEAVSTVHCGWYDIGTSATIINTDVMLTADLHFTIPKHPQAAARGSFLNASPFSQYSLYHPSFGTVPLDGCILSKASDLYVQLAIDSKTGTGQARIRIDGMPYQTRPANIGVPVQIAQIATDYVGVATGVAGGIGGILEGFKGIGAAAGAIGSAVNSIFPQVSSSGQNGSYIAFSTPALFYYQFLPVVDEDREDRGRPLCRRATLSSLPGYLLIEDVDIAIAGTADENTQIKSYMEGGFFFE